MGKNTLKSAKSEIINSENLFVHAARSINGIIIGVDSWRRRYGKRQYYTGFQSDRWIGQKDDWTSRLDNASFNLDGISNILNGVRKTLRQKNVSIEVLNTIIKRVAEKKEYIDKLKEELVTIDDDSLVSSFVKEKERKQAEKLYHIQVDAFFDDISRLSAIQPLYHILCKQIVPLLDKRIQDSKRKESKVKDNTPQTLKEQLIDYQQRCEKEKEENDAYNKWITAQYKTLESFSIPCSRLLSQEESFGICEIPIVLVNSYINEDAIKRLVWSGYKIDRVLGNYLVIENALLLGVQSDNNEDGLRKSTYIWKDIQKQWDTNAEIRDANFIQKIRHLTHIFDKDLAPIGPMVRKGTHLYAWLIPYKLIQHRNSGFMLKEWDIQLI